MLGGFSAESTKRRPGPQVRDNDVRKADSSTMTQHTFPRRSRLAGLTAIPLVGAMALAGCQAGAADDGPVTIQLATETHFGETSSYGAIIDEFNATNDQGITVELVEIPTDTYFQTIRTQVQAGNAPDIIWGSPGAGAFNALGGFAEAGQLVDLSGEDWATASIPESARDLYYVDDLLMAVPVDVAPISQVVNVTAYEALGIDFATTFDEVLEQCAAVRDAGLTSLLGLAGAQASNTGLMGVQIAASHVYAQDPDWNQKRADGDVTFAESDEWQDTLQAVLDLQEAGCFQDGAEGGTPETVTPVFAAGQVFGIFAPSGIAADLAQVAPDSVVSVAAFPGEAEEDTFIYASPSNALSINAASEHIDAAKALLEYWMQPDVLNQFAEMSGNVSLASVLNGEPVGERYANLEPYLTNASRNAPLPNMVWPNPEVYNELGVGIQGLLTGQATIDQVLEAMDAAWES